MSVALESSASNETTEIVKDFPMEKKVVNENGFEKKWLSASSEVKRSEHPLLKPKGGEKIIFTWKSEKESRDFTRDGYRLRMMGGPKRCRFDGNPELGLKYYYHAIVSISTTVTPSERKKTVYETSSKFSKTVWTHPDHRQTAFVEYTGDHSLPLEMPHQNALYEPKTTRPFISTAPSVIAAAAAAHEAPGVAYRALRNAGPREVERQVLEAPRDMEQVQNAQKNSRMALRVSRDEIFNTVVIGNEKQLVDIFRIMPDVIVFGFNPNTIEILRSLLQPGSLPVGLFIDTTFETGNFYATILSFIQTEFKNQPTIPAYFMLHERRTVEVHNTFWGRVISTVPELESSNNWYLISDEEAGFVVNVKNHLPNAIHLRCWNHVLQNIERKLLKLNCNRTEIAEYQKDVTSLFKQKSETDYYRSYFQVCGGWHQDFRLYYEKFINKDIGRIGIWVVQKFGITDLTSNRAESLNANLKRFNDWKKCPLDCMVLAMHRLFQSYYNEIILGRYRMGNYVLRDELKTLYNLSTDKPLLPDQIDPLRIYDDIKHAHEEATRIDNNSLGATQDPEKEIQELASLSTYARAMHILKKGYVKFNSENIGTFRIDIPGENIGHTARLFPQPTCTCISGSVSRSCYHILAILIGFGKGDTGTKLLSKKKNITIYRQRAMKRILKNAGKKVSTKRDTKQVKTALSKKSIILKKTSLSNSVNDSRCSQEVSVEVHRCSTPQHSIEWDDSLSRFQIESPEKSAKVPVTNIDNVNSELHQKEEVKKDKVRDNELSSGGCTNSKQSSGNSIKTAKDAIIAETFIKTKTDEVSVVKQATTAADSPAVEGRATAGDGSLAGDVISSAEDGPVIVEVASISEGSVVEVAAPSEGSIFEVAATSEGSFVEVAAFEVTDGSVVELPASDGSFMLGAVTTATDKENEPRKKVTDCRRSVRCYARDIAAMSGKEWLLTTHINAALTLIRTIDPTILGLFNVQHGAKACYPRIGGDKWIQIINDNQNHWLLAASGFFGKKTIAVYDSLNPTCKPPNDWVVATIASLVKSEEKKICITVMPCQKQSNSYDCGVFAIAFACAIAFGKDPSALKFMSSTLRTHLIESLNSRKITEFKANKCIKRTGEKSYNYSIYCSCRRPQVIHDDTRDSMALCEKCGEWFHKDCQKIPSLVFKDGKTPWSCSSCQLCSQ